ncbi:MAG: hypothetical protein LLF90_08260, partial [Methanomicrobiaceae archaeon]|nr:hypothetical protein [Methanomicrobiaceae archaeon]
MSERDTVAALKRLAGAKPEFRLSELQKDTGKGQSRASLADIIRPHLDDLGLTLRPAGDDYVISRRPEEEPLTVSDAGRERQLA